MKALVYAVQREAAAGSPPYDPRALATWLGVDIVPTPGSMRLGGIRLQDGRMIIELAESEERHNRFRGRERFTEAHEVAHVLIRTAMLDSGFAAGRSAGKEEEGLAAVGATEILMPEPVVKVYLEHREMGFETVMRFAHDFDVSLHAASLRLADCDGHFFGATLLDAEVQEESAYVTPKWAVGIMRTGENYSDPQVVRAVVAAASSTKPITRDALLSRGRTAVPCTIDTGFLARSGPVLVVAYR